MRPEYRKEPTEILKDMLKNIDTDIMKTYGFVEKTGIKKENRKRLRRAKARILTELNARKKNEK